MGGRSSSDSSTRAETTNNITDRRAVLDNGAMQFGDGAGGNVFQRSDSYTLNMTDAGAMAAAAGMAQGAFQTAFGQSALAHDLARTATLGATMIATGANEQAGATARVSIGEMARTSGRAMLTADRATGAMERTAGRALGANVEVTGRALDAVRGTAGDALYYVSRSADRSADTVAGTASEAMGRVSSANSDALFYVNKAYGGALDSVKGAYGGAADYVERAYDKASDRQADAVSAVRTAYADSVAAVTRAYDGATDQAQGNRTLAIAGLTIAGVLALGMVSARRRKAAV